jgi:hypothetical protein
MTTATIVALSAACLTAGALIGATGRAMARALGAGILYGVADAAIKAVELRLGAHGLSAALSGWTVLACGATFAGFISFQRSLRDGNAVSAIALMTSLVTLTALLFGVTAFHESLGSTPAVTSVHLVAIALVLACVPLLAGAEAHAEGGFSALRSSARAALARSGRAVAAAAGRVGATVIAVLAGTGLLYGLRGFGWLRFGPGLGDSLPLLQLAGFDAQPVARVVVAWLLAGVALGVLLPGSKLRSRVVIAVGLGLPLLLFASECSFAVARNLRLTDVLSGRVPGPGAWTEALLMAAGAALPHQKLTLRFPREVLAPVLRARTALSGR